MVATTEALQKAPPPPPDDDPEADDKRMTIQEHLEEFRTRLIISVAAVLIGMIPGVLLSSQIFEILRALLHPPYRLVIGEVTEGFMVWLYIGLYVGLALAMPVIVYQISMFVGPALTKDEKKFILWTLPPVFGFFVLGVLFAYFLVVPNALNFLVGFGEHHLPGTEALIRVGDFLSFTLGLMFWVGVSFETPVIVVALKKVGLLNDQRIKMVRRYFIVIAFVVAAFITPTPDPINQIIVAVPIIILYEIGALVAKVV